MVGCVVSKADGAAFKDSAVANGGPIPRIVGLRAAPSQAKTNSIDQY